MEMIRIKTIKQKDYLIMDVILIILSNKNDLNIPKLQYELLKYGILIGQPLLRIAIKKLEEDKLVSSGIMDAALN